jgi:hypothetical protein
VSVMGAIRWLDKSTTATAGTADGRFGTAGRSCHGAPVRKTHSTPLSTARASRHGRPRPSGRRFSSNNGSMIVHCWSVRSMPVRHEGSTVTVYEKTSNLTLIGGTLT